MVKNRGDTQARFFSKEPGFFSCQHAAVSIQLMNIYREGREGRKES